MTNEEMMNKVQKVCDLLSEELGDESDSADGVAVLSCALTATIGVAAYVIAKEEKADFKIVKKELTMRAMNAILGALDSVEVGDVTDTKDRDAKNDELTF